MSTATQLRAQRDRWRKKTGDAKAKLRYQGRENQRLKSERDRYKKAFRESQRALAQARRQQELQRVESKAQLILLALQLFLVARIGFRAVSRVLGVLVPYLGLAKPPCAQTLINWVTRLTLVRLRGALSPSTFGQWFPRGYLLLLDISIGLGQGKILTVLALDLHHHENAVGAPALGNLRVLAVAVADTWTGESIAELLAEVIARVGPPRAYLKDGGTDLAKAVRLLSAPAHAPALSIDDISHAFANLLRHAFEHHPLYPVFLSACGAVSKRLKQTLLACLAPPKVSTKARFMNLHRWVTWADRLLKQSPPGRAAKGSLLEKLRARFEQLPATKPFIRAFLANAQPLLACQQLLKTRGLNQATYDQCQPLVAAIANPAIRTGVSQWLDTHLAIARTLGVSRSGLPISTDSLESLFGVAKRLGTGEVKDANRIALRLPALCGELTQAEATQVAQITVKEHNAWVGSLPSLIKQRRDVFHQGRGLEAIEDNAAQPSLRLILGSESAQKNAHPIDQKRDFKNGDDPCPSPG